MKIFQTMRVFQAVLSFSMVFALVLLAACGGSSAPQELQRGVKTVGRMLSPNQMKQSMFYAAYPEGTPSEYVRFMFSPLGAAEIPPQEGGLEVPEGTNLGPGGPPLLPKGVILKPEKPLADSEDYQLVFSADDAKGVVIVKGYLPTKTEPKAEPVLTKEFSLPKVEPDPMAQAAFESNRDLGASPW